MTYASKTQKAAYQKGYRERMKGNPSSLEKDHAAQKRYRAKAGSYAKLKDRQYGLGEGGYEALVQNQTLDGEKYSRCAICMNRGITRRLGVDHDHTTGKARGTLLCVSCNKNLGQWENDPIRCYNAILYLLNIIEDLGGMPKPVETTP